MEHQEDYIDEEEQERQWLESLEPDERDAILKVEEQKAQAKKLATERRDAQSVRDFLFNVSGCGAGDIYTLARQKDLSDDEVYIRYLEGGIELSEFVEVAKSAGRQARVVLESDLEAFEDDAEMLSLSERIPLDEAYKRTLVDSPETAIFLAKKKILNKEAESIMLEDISHVQLGNGAKEIWLNILREGIFSTRYGKLRFDRDFLGKLIQSFESNLIQRKIPLDVAHRAHDSASRGWLERLKLVGNKLMGLFSLTPIGSREIRDKTYRYCSAELDENYVDKETGRKHGPALLAISLTNTPAIPGLEVAKLEEKHKIEFAMQDLGITEKQAKFFAKHGVL